MAATVTQRGTDCDYVVQDRMSRRFVRIIRKGHVRWVCVPDWDTSLRQVVPTKADAVALAGQMIDGP